MIIILRWLLNSIALLAIAEIVPGIHIASYYTALITLLFLGLVNAVIRPILLLLTLPITLLTLGLFIFVINALMILLVSTVVKGFEVAGFGPALIASVVLWFISLLTNFLLNQGEKNH